MGVPYKWTEKKTNTLIDLYKKDYTLRAIADVLSITVSSVSGKLVRLRAQGIVLPERGSSVDKTLPSKGIYQARKQIAEQRQMGVREPPKPTPIYTPPVLFPAKHCQWAEGEGKDIKFQCMTALEPPGSYCSKHRQIVYLKK